MSDSDVGQPLGWRSRFLFPSIGFPSWSAENPERLTFVSNEGGTIQLWTSRVGGDDRRPLTDQRVGVEEFVMSPRGDAAAWWSDDSGDGNGAWVATNLDSGNTIELLQGLHPGWSEGIAWCADRVAIAISDGSRYRIYDGRPGGEGRLLYQSTQPAGLGREWTTTPGGLSTDGDLVCLRHSEHGDMLHFGLRVLRASDGTTVGDLVDTDRTVRVSSWSPVAGDNRVAIIHELDGIERPAVWSPEADGRVNYPSDLPGEIDVNGWYPDASALLVTHWHDGLSQLLRLDLSSGEYTLVEDPGGYVSGAAVRPDGVVWLREESGTRPPRVRTTDGVTVLASPGSAPSGVAHKSVRFAGPTGETTQMMLAVPEGEGPHPTLMYVHGGPEWAESDRYDPWAATLVDHGVAVAKVNYRGSTGFGEAWRTSIHDGNIGIPEAADVVSGLGYLIDMGVADPSRCAIEGWSWGGYIAAMAIGLTLTPLVLLSRAFPFATRS